MVCLCIKKFLEPKKRLRCSNKIISNHDTLTFILAYVHCQFVNSHGRFDLEPSKVASLAWNGLLEKKLRFDKNDLLMVALENVKENAYLTVVGKEK